jgi:hypothetical protein
MALAGTLVPIEDEAVATCGTTATPGLLTLIPVASFIEAGGWATGVDVAGGNGSDVTAGGCSAAGGLGSTGGAPSLEVLDPVVPELVVLEPVDDEEDDVLVVEVDELEPDAVFASPSPPPPPQPPNSAATASPIRKFLFAFIFRSRPV